MYCNRENAIICACEQLLLHTTTQSSKEPRRCTREHTYVKWSLVNKKHGLNEVGVMVNRERHKQLPSSPKLMTRSQAGSGTLRMLYDTVIKLILLRSTSACREYTRLLVEQAWHHIVEVS